MTGEELLKVTGRSGIMPVFNHSDPQVALEVIKICHELGINAFEFTIRGEGSEEVFREVRAQTKNWEGFFLGVGTIVNSQQTRKFIDYGADFIVAPILDLETGALCAEHGISWTPGCMTLTELIQAKENGAVLSKVFPANVLGPGFVKAIKGPCPDLNIMPTGGVDGTEPNLRSWFDAGVHCIGLGSSVFKISDGGVNEMESLRQALTTSLEIVQSLRS